MVERGIEFLLAAAASVAVVTMLGVVLVLGIEAAYFFAEVSPSQFLLDTQWTPLFADKHFGIWPLVCGTAVTSVIALLVAVPSGLTIAIYLSEYASKRSRTLLKPVLELLAGIPTIVYGYFALLVVTPALRILLPDLPGFNALSPGLVMGLMILPMVASLSEDALFAVPNSLREAALAMGATKLQMVFRTLLPAALGGISSAVLLAVGRAVGETMIVAVAAGQQPQFSLNPLEPLATMTTYIVQVSLGDTPHHSLEYKTIFAVGMMLFLLTFLVNAASYALRKRYIRAL